MIPNQRQDRTSGRGGQFTPAVRRRSVFAFAGLGARSREVLSRTVWLALCIACLLPLLARAQDRTTPTPVDVHSLNVEDLFGESDFHGGLVVLAGVVDSRLAVAAAQSYPSLVHVLVSERADLDAVRAEIRSAGVYGQVSASVLNAPALPYADGLVNLLVLHDEGLDLPTAEIRRVLCPGGVAWIRRGDRLAPMRKPWPDDVDQWSHSRYDATGNAVSKDRRVGPPQYLQWEAWPRWNHGTKTSCLVSAPGRIFYILDDSHFASSARTWSLIARDAANGIQLWRHELDGWEGARGGKKVGPAQVHRRLVAIGDRVYATLGEAAPVSVLDAATGEVLRTLSQTAPASEFVVSNGILVVFVDPNTPAEIRRGITRMPRIVAADPESGQSLWTHETERILPLTVAADDRQVVYHDGDLIHSLDLKTGEPRWVSAPTGQEIAHADSANPDRPGAQSNTIMLAPQFAPTMVLYQGVVAFAGGCQLNVLSSADGSELWRTTYAPSNYSVPVDLFGFSGALWGPDPGMNLWRPLDDNIDFNAYDPLSGALLRSVEGNYGFRFQHHRCHQMKVVANTVLAARAGVEYLDTTSGSVASHHWVRGSCYFGVMPANGMLYVPPHNCACYIRAKLSGFMALKAMPSPRSGALPQSPRLRSGPAYGHTADLPVTVQADDWPTYRHDAARSGRASTTVGAELLLGWQRDLGGGLTSPVVAGNRVYVASLDTHILTALDAETGATLWEAAFDARVDSPPTVYQGLVLCGCRDGSVTALCAEDGALAWRFLASPRERLIVSYGQLESAWPLPGSILVVNDTVYVAAGKSSYLDGGIQLYGLDPHTGKVRFEKALWTREEDGSQLMDEQSVDGFLNDVLSSDGEHIFMRHQVFDLGGGLVRERVPHLHSPDGFLSSSTTTRLLWTYAPVYTSPHQGAFYDLRLSRMLFPSGTLLVEDDEAIYGYGQNHYNNMRPQPGGTWALFSAAKSSGVSLELTAREYREVALAGETAVPFHWWQRVPVQVRALVGTADVLFAGGPRGIGVTSPEALAGETAARLLAVSPKDGEVLADMSLPGTPVWDGLAAARGNLYAALANGTLVCLWSADSGRPGTPLSPAGWSASLPPVETAAEPGLVGRWRFDEGVGMLARDCSGNGHHAEVAGRWVKGDFGHSLRAEGIPQAAVIPDAPHFHFGNDDFALALWVKLDGHDARLIGKEAFPENWWVINLLNDGRAELVLGEGRGTGRSVRAKTESAISTDAWSHLVAVVDREAAEVRWFVNGTAAGREPIPEQMTDGIHADGRDISIPSSHKPFRGLVGDLRIYRTALSDERVRDLYLEQAERRVSTEFETR